MSSVRALVALCVVLVLALQVQCRSKRTQDKSKRGSGVKPGCCPPSYTMRFCVYSSNGESECNKFYAWDDEEVATAKIYQGNIYIRRKNSEEYWDIDKECIREKNYGLPNTSFADVCLTSNAVNEGTRKIKFPDGRKFEVQVYSMSDYGGIRRYFLPNEENCVPVGEVWGSEGSRVFYTYNIQLGSPSIFQESYDKCEW